MQLFLDLAPKGPVDSMSPLVQIMAWHWTGDKPLPEPVMSQVTYAYTVKSLI